MGKTPYMYTDSETEDTSASSVSSMKKKKFSVNPTYSILKYTNGNVKKKKCKVHSKSEPDDSDYRSRSRSKVKYKLPGILKHSENDRYSSEEDDDSEPTPTKPFSHSRYLVGRVPRPAGAKPGRGGGVAIIVKKNVSSLPAPQISSASTKRTKFSTKRLSKKRSY